jgi:hypothetical protein
MNKQKTISPLLILSLAVILNLPIPSAAQAKSDAGSPVVDQGKFTLHKFEEPIGVECYEIRRDGDSAVVKMDFKFTDRMTPVSLAATFRSAPDFTPQSFEIKGKTARSASIDEALSIDGGSVHFRTRDKQSELNVPKGAFFSIAGYAPMTMQMLLVGYQVIEAGQDQINHIIYIADMMHEQFPADMSRNDRRKITAAIDLDSAAAHKALAFLKEHRTVVDPTLAVQELFTASTAKPPSSFEPGVTKVAPELASQLTDVEPPNEVSELRERVFQKEVAIVGALHRAGILIVAGTDQAVPGHSLHREIELYVQAGLTPMEALQAATIASARAMGLEKESGTLEKGKRGDLILINGNPLEDIHNMRNVAYVVTGGTIYDPAKLWQSVGFRP